MRVFLAHGLAQSGPSIEALVVATAMGVVGVTLFVQKSGPPLVPLAMVGIALLIGVGAFTVLDREPAASPDHATSHEETYEGALAGICLAASSARNGDAESARVFFLDRAHTTLHELAIDVEAEDRALSAELLEAKQSVEAAISEQQPARRLAGALEDLAVATESSLRAVGLEPTPCA